LAPNYLTVPNEQRTQKERLILLLVVYYRPRWPGGDLPAVYYERSYVPAGGLISYGSDYLEQCRRAAGYVDRVLKGANPADLPVQAPVK
jgi:hypothetical protein